MTPQEFAAAQARLDLSDRAFGVAVGFVGGNVDKTVRRLKHGDRSIDGRVAMRVDELLRAAARAELMDRYVFGESEDGRTEYMVRLAPPGFVATITAVADEAGVEDLRVVAWLDAPPATMEEGLALMREAAGALNAYTRLPVDPAGA